jgi:phenylpropionate dioxygenase-like ring-hydroxylating dioxygenase large terminal subunit
MDMSDFAMEPLVYNAWYIGAWANELDDGPIARKVMNENLVLFRSGGGTAAALEDRCCHRGVKLSLGCPVENGIMCGYHGLVFDGAGTCVDNPGEKPNTSFKVKSFPVVERQKFVWIWMGDPALADESEIIDFPYHDMEDQYNFHFGRYDIAANYMFMMDNLMDLTHLGYVHATTIGGNPEEHDDAEMTTIRTERGAHFNRKMPNSTPPPSFKKAASFEGQIDRYMDFQYVSPASVLQWAGIHDAGTGGFDEPAKEGGLVLRLFHHATPIDDANFHYFFSTAVRGEAYDGAGNLAFHKDVLEAFKEDKLFIEAQQEAVGEHPERRLLLREHDKAVAYSRQSIHKLQEAEKLPKATE